MQTHTATVTERMPLTPRMVRLTVAGPSLVGLRPQPAQDIELLLRSGPRRVKRRYTIRYARPETGEFDVDVFLHGDGGPGGEWGEAAQPGDTVEFVGPRGKLELRPADWHLFVGDEASLPAIAALIEALGPDAVTVVLAEIGDDLDRIPLAARRVEWIPRARTPAGTPDLLGAALDALVPPAGTGQAYLLGESRSMRDLRGRLPRLGIAADRAFVKGYWNANRHPRPAHLSI